MSKSKQWTMVIFVIGIAFVLLAANNAFAYRPPDPQSGLMGFNPDGRLWVPQNVGIYDKYYGQFEEPECRVCHGADTSPRHHSTQWYYTGDCLHCHVVTPGPGIEPTRDCLVCHPATEPLLGGGGPHHATDLADSDQCTQCHDPNLLVETWSVPPPSGPPDPAVMPRPWTCENCHWHNPAGAANGLPDDIQANGPVTWCSLGGVNPALPMLQRYLPADGTHHEVDEKVYTGKCFNCHSSSPEHEPDHTCEGDPSGMHLYLIRYCENCHSMDTLHGISEHVTAGHGMTANEKCVACHGSYPVGEWEVPSVAPTLKDDAIWPGNNGSSDIIIKVQGNDFGERSDGDWIRIGTGVAGWWDMPIYSWSNTQIEAKVPPSYPYGSGLPGGASYNIKVHKEPIPAVGYAGGTTTVTSFTVNKHPEVLSVSPIYGAYDTDLTINSIGNSFGTSLCTIPIGSGDSGTGDKETPVGNDKLYDSSKGWTSGQWVDYYVTVEDETNAAGEVNPRKIISNGPKRLQIDGEWKNPGTSKKYIILGGKNKYVWGHCYYVKYESGADDYRMGCYNSMSPSTILTDLKYLYDINEDRAVDPSEYYLGDWNIYVVSEYFIDDGDRWHYNAASCAGIPGSLPDPTKPPGFIDKGDKVIEPTNQNLQNWYYRETSDPPFPFTIVDTPVLKCIRPCNGPAGTLINITGQNFGISQGAKVLRFGAKAFYEGSPRIKLWSNTRIKFKVPNMATKGKNYKVWIIDDSGSPSNKKRFYLTN